jgi:hypothetical protein
MAQTIFLLLCSAGELFFVYTLVYLVKENSPTPRLFSISPSKRIPIRRVNVKIIEISVRLHINQQSLLVK